MQIRSKFKPSKLCFYVAFSVFLAHKRQFLLVVLTNNTEQNIFKTSLRFEISLKKEKNLFSNTSVFRESGIFSSWQDTESTITPPLFKNKFQRISTTSDDLANTKLMRELLLFCYTTQIGGEQKLHYYKHA